MTGIIEVEIHGVKRPLMFNNFATVELSKHLDVDPLRILESVQELNNRNHLLMIKLFVYAGHCGDCYRRQNTTDLTMDEIGDWVATASDDDLYAIYKCFMDAAGLNLPEDEIKKKPKTPRKPRAGRK